MPALVYILAIQQTNQVSSLLTGSLTTATPYSTLSLICNTSRLSPLHYFAQSGFRLQPVFLPVSAMQNLRDSYATQTAVQVFLLGDQREIANACIGGPQFEKWSMQSSQEYIEILLRNWMNTRDWRLFVKQAIPPSQYDFRFQLERRRRLRTCGGIYEIKKIIADRFYENISALTCTLVVYILAQPYKSLNT